MYLKSAHLRNWGCHDDLPVEFGEALNVCIGPNGAGKSTLYHAIVAALTVKHSTKDQKIHAYRSWGRDGFGPTASIEIVRDDGTWSLTKTYLHSPQCLLEQDRGAGSFKARGQVAEQHLDGWLEGDGAAGRLILTLWSNQNDPTLYQEVPGSKPNSLGTLLEKAIAQASRPDAAGPFGSLKKKVADEYAARFTPEKRAIKTGSDLHEALRRLGDARRDRDALLAKKADLASKVEEFRGRSCRHGDDCRDRDDLHRRKVDRDRLAHDYRTRAEALRIAEEKASGLREGYDALRDAHDELARAEADLASAEARLEALAPELGRADEVRVGAARALKAAESRLALARPMLDRLVDAFDRNARLASASEALTGRRAAEDAARDRCGLARSAHDRAEARLREARAGWDRATRGLEDAVRSELLRDLRAAEEGHRSAEAAHRHALAADRFATRAALRDRRDRARALSDRREALGTDGGDGPVPSPVELEALVAEDRRLEGLSGTLDADAITVRLVAEAPITARLTGDGGSSEAHELAPGRSAEGRGTTSFSIAIEGVGRIEVGRAAGVPSARREQLLRGREEVAGRLRAWGASDVAGLERRVRRAEERRGLREMGEALLGGQTMADLEASLAALDAELQSLGLDVDDPAPPAPPGPGLAGLAARKHEAEIALAKARAACPPDVGGNAPDEGDPEPAEARRLADLARVEVEVAERKAKAAALDLARAEADLANAADRREEAGRGLDEVAGGVDPDGLAADIRSEIDATRDELAALGVAHPGAETRGWVQFVEKQLDDAIGEARGTDSLARERWNALDKEHRLTEQARDHLASALVPLRRKFDPAPDPGARAASLKARESQVLRAEAEAGLLRDALPPDPSADQSQFEALVAASEARCREGEMEMVRLNAEISEKGADGLDSQLARAEERLARSEARAEEARRDASAWALLHHLLAEVEEEQSRNVAAQIQSLATGAIRQLTAGTASEVLFDPRTLAPFAAKVPGLDFNPGLEQFSRGTREQVALASRLQIGLLLSKDRFRHMLLLDDPLAHTDAPRLKSALDMLVSLCGQLQLIIFTCHEDRYRGLGDLAKFIEIG